MKKIFEMFTYADGGGIWRLRDYVKVTLGILVLALAVIAVGVSNRYQMISNVMATPRALDAGLIPTPTEEVSNPVTQTEECPSDPARWTLTDNLLVPSSNLKGLAPQCVYDGLEKTAAWLYATYVLGHSRSESTRLFGFTTTPMAYSLETGQIMVLSDFKDEAQKVNLRFPSDNTGLAEWRIDWECSRALLPRFHRTAGPDRNGRNSPRKGPENRLRPCPPRRGTCHPYVGLIPGHLP